jgi:ATP-dependent RNA helicase DeaD
MDSFEELGLGPALVEALAAEGIEVPTALQAHVIPVLKRGNSALLRAGPGAGVLAAWGSAILEGVEPGGHQPGALVLTPTVERSQGLATSLARMALATGHRVAALGNPWALPSHADVLVSSPRDLLGAVRSAEVKLDRVSMIVLDGAQALREGDEGEVLDAVLEAMSGAELQWIVVADPVGEAVRSFMEARAPRAVTLPPEAAARNEEQSPVQRGRLEAWTVEGGTYEALPALVAEALEGDHRHILLFFRSDDRAADGGDLLAIHGFMAGAPGDGESPVWIGSDPLEAREAVKEAMKAGLRVLVASVDVPPDADLLDRRHGAAPDLGLVLIHPRELPHLRRIAGAAGYQVSVRPSGPSRQRDDVGKFRDEVEATITGTDLAPYLVLLEPLLERWDGAEVAAALAALLRRKGPALGESSQTGAAVAPSRTPEVSAPQTWVKLFLSIGQKDGVGPGDLVGAITGEAGLEGHQVGRIEVRDTFSRVDVQEEVAGRVIQALNGVSIRGRSVRADYDRAEGRGGRPDGGRGGPGRGRGGGASPGGKGRRPPGRS